MAKGSLDIEHFEKGNRQVFDRLLVRFIKLDKTLGDDKKMSELIKLGGQIGFLAQCAAGLGKTTIIQKDIAEINKRLDRIPPELLERYVNTALEPTP